MGPIPEALIPIIAIVGGLIIAALAIIAGLIKTTSHRRHYEESRREIAAYVAEGSITPDDAQRLLTTESHGSGGGSKSPVAVHIVKE
jgi:hypothetical protein